jgi:ankyrin repeat protein
MQKAAKKNPQQTFFEILTSTLPKPHPKWLSDHDLDLSAQLASFLSARDEHSFAGQINTQQAIKDHFVYLIYDRFKSKLDENSDPGEILKDSSLVTSILTSAKQTSQQTNQLFGHLTKSAAELKSFLDTSTHIPISLTRADGKNCFHLIAENTKTQTEDTQKKIDFLISRGLDLNAESADGTRPLVAALQSGNFAIFSYFKEKEACDIHFKNEKGQNLLHIILNLYDIKKPDQELVGILPELIDEVSLLDKDKNELSPLNLIIQKELSKAFNLILSKHLSKLKDREWEEIVTDAVIYNHEQILKKALSYEQAKKFVNDGGADGKSLAQIAVENDNDTILELLKEYDADFSVQDKDGNSLGHLAVTKPKIFKYLLEKKHINLTTKNKLGEDILTLASKSGSNDVIDLLLENAPESINQIFVNAVSFGHINLVKHILEDKQKVKQNEKTANTVEMLICNKYKLKLDWKENGENILQKAISSFGVVKSAEKKTKILGTIDYFLTFIKDNSAILDDVNIHGDAPIHSAINLNAVDLVKMLVKHKANLNKPDSFKLTPIQIAIQEEQTDIVTELLVGADLDLCVSKTKNQTLLHMAANIHDISILESIWKAINTKSEIKNIILQQNSDQENFLHILLKNSNIAIEKRDAFLETLIPALKNDDFRQIFDQENSKRETARNLFTLDEKLNEKFLAQLPEYVMPVATKNIAEKSMKKDVTKTTSTNIGTTQLSLEELAQDVSEIKTKLDEFKGDFDRFKDLILTEFKGIRDILSGEIREDDSILAQAEFSFDQIVPPLVTTEQRFENTTLLGENAAE